MYIAQHLRSYQSGHSRLRGNDENRHSIVFYHSLILKFWRLLVARVMLSKILNCKAGVFADMAIRLSAWLKITPDLWVGIQSQWDLWQAEQKPRPMIRPLEQIAA